MDGNGTHNEPRGIITDWTVEDVCAFFDTLCFPQFQDAIREHTITGDLLAIMDAESFKELGLSVGQRLAVLKAVYLVKLQHDIPIGSDDYVPPSEVAEKPDDLTIEKLHNLLKSHAQRLLQVEEENRTLRTTLQAAIEDMNRRPLGGDDSPLHRQKSFKWAEFVKPSRSPTKAEASIDSPQASPRRSETDYNQSLRTPTIADSTRTTGSSDNLVSAAPKRQDSMDNLRTGDVTKSFKVSLEDPAWKVLPAALKKYKINNDDWQNYAMFICYGSTGNRIERCLSYDEKPLLLFQKLKDAKKNPVFMLKHIKDIRSPIAVAQQKHAARKANTPQDSASTPNSSAQDSKMTQPGRTGSRPPRITVDNDGVRTTPPLMTGNTMQAGWPELLSPAVETSHRLGDTSLADTSMSTNESAARTSPPVGENEGSARGAVQAREMLPPTAQGISYAVAIYPYMAEQEDEFDVIVGDTFVILSRARGWWVVQRDPAGTGIVETDTSKQGWVPAGCLLETRVPVASAIAEASGATDAATPQNRRTPIMPLSIVSTSFPGVALTDYTGKGDEELDLLKDDLLRVFKRYNHWSYAVKEDTGDRGWVPSWYIGKVNSPNSANESKAIANGVPATPSAIVPPSLLHGPMSDEPTSTPGGNPQPSPMSSAFPVAGGRM